MIKEVADLEALKGKAKFPNEYVEGELIILVSAFLKLNLLIF